ncbi:MAG: Swt1 family HEPN domain-containing protein, partial [Thermoplasmata archaeon]
WPWAPGGSDDPLDYIDFADYIKIITRKDNWKQWFSSVFGDRDIITAKLRELEPIRNSLVHSRPLRPRDFERLKLAVEDIVDSVNQANP